MNVFYLQIVHLSIRPKEISFTLFLEAVPRELLYFLDKIQTLIGLSTILTNTLCHLTYSSLMKIP